MQRIQYFRRASLLATALIAILSGPSMLAAQGTATLNPQFPARGAQATVSYNATGGPLAAQTPVVVVGYNGFQGTVAATMTGTAPNWSHTFTVPATATSIDIYFRNAASSIFDNNGGNNVDWQFVVSETQTAPLGATTVPANLGGGWLFRVWAPNVTTSSVVGQWNSFATRRDLMQKNATSGIWTAHVTGATNNQRYKYLFNGTTYRRDPRARRVTNSVGDSVLYNPDAFDWSADQPVNLGNFRDMVIYEMHVGTLDRAGSPNGATFFSLLLSGRLDYLKDLGINAVKVMPVFEFPGDISGGYNPSDPFAIESAYGGPDGLKAFVRACHQRGIAVIMDVVHNHYGPNDLDMRNFEGLGAPGIYFYTSPPSLAEAGFGPRPDYSKTEVRRYIQDNITMLLDEYRMDGLRWDFTKGIRSQLDGGFNLTTPIPDGISLMQTINSSLAQRPNFINIAEDLAGDSRITQSISAINGNMNSGLGFDSQWDVDFHYRVVEELQNSNDSTRNIGRIRDVVHGNFSRVHFVESHDEVWALNNKTRTPARFDSVNPESLIARRKASLAAGLLFTSTGIPMLFQGQEILDIGVSTNNRSWSDGTGINWSRRSNPNVEGILSLYRDLISLRRNMTGVSLGLQGTQTNTFFVDQGGTKVLAYTRSTGGNQPGDTVVIMANFSAVPYSSGFNIGLPESGTWYEVFNSDNTTYGTDFTGAGVGQVVPATGAAQHGFAQSGRVTIGAYSFVILSKAQPVDLNQSWVLY